MAIGKDVEILPALLTADPSRAAGDHITEVTLLARKMDVDVQSGGLESRRTGRQFEQDTVAGAIRESVSS
jgi:hypothetical protein